MTTGASYHLLEREPDRHAERVAPEIYVQFGCGNCVGDGWLNYDASLTLRFERLPLVRRLRRKNTFPAGVLYGDIVKGLPLEDGSCTGVYASHVLEHLALEDCRAALRNTFRLLRPGGVFRVVVPNLEACARSYLSDKDETAAHSFMRYTNLGVERLPRTPFGAALDWFRRGKHLWMWDYNSLKHELDSVGFTRVRRCAFGDSLDPMFGQVERPSRYEYEALAIECFKE